MATAQGSASLDVEATPAKCDTNMGAKVPVMLVHGFNSAATTWNKGRAVLGADLANTCLIDFDYSAYSTQWVKDDRIGKALAARIVGLSDRSRSSGGTGKLVVIGHSMGGLALRCAAAPSCGGDERVPSRLALAITFGTPNDGTFLAGNGRSLIKDVLKPFLTLGACADGWEKLCVTARALLTSSASSAFTPGSGQLNALPALPSSVPVRAMAGSVRIRTRLGAVTYPVGDAGDLVVNIPSALGRARKIGNLGGEKVISCGTFTLPVDRPPACHHVNETAYNEFTKDAATQIRLVVAANSAQLLKERLPPVAATDATAKQVESFLRAALGPDEMGTECNVVAVLGFAPARRAAVIYAGITTACGGDRAGTVYVIRGRSIIAKGDACGDCGWAEPEFEKIAAPYEGRTWAGFDVVPGPKGWALMPSPPLPPS
jgi:pimeloyl-ACP methyl ester carboxylesterase